MADKTLLVRFDPPGTPPAVLVVGDVTIPAGGEHELPADIAQALIDDPEMNVSLASDEATTPPETGDTPKEN